MALNDDLHSLTDPFAQDLRELGLALPAVLDGLKKRRGGFFRERRPERCLK